MKLSFRPYELQLKHTFTVAGHSRNTTPVVLTEVEYERGNDPALTTPGVEPEMLGRQAR